MIMELIERKNKPIRTKMQFTKNEWNKVPQESKDLYENFEKHETSRHIYFLIDGDLINEEEDIKDEL